MGIFEKLFGSVNNSEIFTNEELGEANICPNCWGKQEYDDQYIEYVKDQTKDNINHDKQHQKAFIQQFVETNVTGIRLKQEGQYQACPVCQTKYKKVSNKAT
mgnify:CR=1 FL=1